MLWRWVLVLDVGGVWASSVSEKEEIPVGV